MGVDIVKPVGYTEAMAVGRKPDYGVRMGPAIFVKLPPDLEANLRRTAEEEFRPISSLIRAILMQWWEENGETRPERKTRAKRAVG